MFYILPLLFLLPAIISANPAPILGIGIGRTQSAGVEGILTCEGKPASNVLVKLYDDDRGIDTDDLMEGRREKGGGNEPANAANKWSFLGAVVKLTAKLFTKWFSINKKKSVENEPSNPKENLPSRNKRWESGKARKNGTILAEGRTDDEGHFKLEGYTQEITDIDPKINVYHDCNDFKPCQRKISIMIPDKYITSGEHPKKYYDAGTIELEGKFKGEERDCIH